MSCQGSCSRGGSGSAWTLPAHCGYAREGCHGHPCRAGVAREGLQPLPASSRLPWAPSSPGQRHLWRVCSCRSPKPLCQRRTPRCEPGRPGARRSGVAAVSDLIAPSSFNWTDRVGTEGRWGVAGGGTLGLPWKVPLPCCPVPPARPPSGQEQNPPLPCPSAVTCCLTLDPHQEGTWPRCSSEVVSQDRLFLLYVLLFFLYF